MLISSFCKYQAMKIFKNKFKNSLHFLIREIFDSTNIKLTKHSHIVIISELVVIMLQLFENQYHTQCNSP
jgi:hypothetical protein